MPFADNRGARIHWREEGIAGGAPLVLLHSIGTDMGLHDELAPFLAPHFRMIRIDIRGHGASSATAGDYDLGLLGSDVLAVMDAAGIDRAIVCGTSLGAMIAMQLVQDAPQRVRGLVLACTSPGMSPVLWPERIATVRSRGMAAVAEGWAQRHFSAGFLASHPARAEGLTRKVAEMSEAGYLGNAAAIRDIDVLPGLPGVAVPATIIAGEDDIATPFAGHGDRIAAAMPAARVEFLPAAHLACIEVPDLFARCVLDLASRCPA